MEDLHRLNRIRNTFCHAPLMHPQGKAEYFFREIDSEQIINMDVDPKDLYNEFNNICPSIMSKFREIANKENWPFEPDPTLDLIKIDHKV